MGKFVPGRKSRVGRRRDNLHSAGLFEGFVIHESSVPEVVRAAQHHNQKDISSRGEFSGQAMTRARRVSGLAANEGKMVAQQLVLYF